jgi:hypothetical protein
MFSKNSVLYFFAIVKLKFFVLDRNLSKIKFKKIFSFIWMTKFKVNIFVDIKKNSQPIIVIANQF